MPKNYSEREALKEVFENIKPGALGKKVYDKFFTYRKRYENGELGQKAVETILNFFGFEKEVIWRKKHSPVPENASEPVSEDNA